MLPGCGRTDSHAADVQLVAGKVHRGCVKSSRHILTGHGNAATNPATWGEITDLVADPPAGEAALSAACVRMALHRVHHEHNHRVRTVQGRALILCAGLEPGPSGWQNLHLRAVICRQSGAERVARWCRLWLQCASPAACACLWTQVIIIPLNRDAMGTKVRPIALGKCLLKFAESVPSWWTKAPCPSNSFWNRRTSQYVLRAAPNR